MNEGSGDGSSGDNLIKFVSSGDTRYPKLTANPPKNRWLKEDDPADLQRGVNIGIFSWANKLAVNFREGVTIDGA